MKNPMLLFVSLIFVMPTIGAFADEPSLPDFGSAQGLPALPSLNPNSQQGTQRREATNAKGTSNSTGTSAPASLTANKLAKLRQGWHQNVERPRNLAKVESQIALETARLESYERRLARLRGFNQIAPPDSDRFFPSQVLPPAQGIQPRQTLQPVKMFAPRSTFSHVLDNLYEKIEGSNLALQELDERRYRMVDEAKSDGVETEAEKEATNSEALAQRVDDVEAELRASQSRLRAIDRRVEQMVEFRRQTYSGLHGDLWEKLKLQQLKAELELANLESELDLLGQYEENKIKEAKEKPAQKPRFVIVR